MTDTKAPEKFEDALEQLQTTVKRLESGDLSLEQALKNFEEGIRLSRLCQEQLSAAEQKVETLIRVSADGQAQTQPFSRSTVEGELRSPTRPKDER